MQESTHAMLPRNPSQRLVHAHKLVSRVDGLATTKITTVDNDAWASDR